MLQTFFIKVLINGVLRWLKSLLDAFIQKQKHIEQGRQEVKDALEKTKKEIESEAKKLRDSDPYWDDTVRRVRDRGNRSGNNLRKDK